MIEAAMRGSLVAWRNGCSSGLASSKTKLGLAD